MTKDVEIAVERQSDGSILADVKSWPGSPPVGRGTNVREALGDWLIYCGLDFGINIKLSDELWKEWVAQFEKER